MLIALEPKTSASKLQNYFASSCLYCIIVVHCDDSRVEFLQLSFLYVAVVLFVKFRYCWYAYV